MVGILCRLWHESGYDLITPAAQTGLRRCYSAFVADNLKLLLRLFAQPAAAMSDILDRGSLLFSAVAVIAVSFLLQGPLGRVFSFYTPLLILAVVYVPGTLLLSKLF